ncbi:putative glutamyl-tRNA synthetase [Neospora caninum Liverpool]|uniref:Putative glutamyl-tRNA synthetase n=1 Tax=Neospora caninum (strain Liverpool) TaxID=572307 RepID=F0VDZ4_NEOCL|nr:putative glutamyl-tRNA synthetase [Neospora caninum Liverpool]CBZ51937.1 putative glutamyl-tRNA synthetase [Neospora caninum Liverpool]|eukprot:XP_003881970.1 putative glutamyl-tRNA synthetase [Neospora caninum Liverpool]
MKSIRLLVLLVSAWSGWLFEAGRQSENLTETGSDRPWFLAEASPLPSRRVSFWNLPLEANAFLDSRHSVVASQPSPFSSSSSLLPPSSSACSSAPVRRGSVDSSPDGGSEGQAFSRQGGEQKRKSEEEILVTRWLGIMWDEGPDVGGPAGPYTQSLRTAFYADVGKQLVTEGCLYPCFCTRDDLLRLRRAAVAAGERPRYNGACRALSPAEQARQLEEAREKNAAFTLRFKVPESLEFVQINDALRGPVRLPKNALSDFLCFRRVYFKTKEPGVRCPSSTTNRSGITASVAHIPSPLSPDFSSPSASSPSSFASLSPPSWIHDSVELEAPVYNFCVALDDWAMGVTHVVRGCDHLINAASQVLLLRALNATVPVYVHSGLLCSPTGAKISKRSVGGLNGAGGEQPIADRREEAGEDGDRRQKATRAHPVGALFDLRRAPRRHEEGSEENCEARDVGDEERCGPHHEEGEDGKQEGERVRGTGRFLHAEESEEEGEEEQAAQGRASEVWRFSPYTVEGLRRRGFLPEAVLLFLSGAHDKVSRVSDLLETFSVEDVGASNLVFDEALLLHLHFKLIRQALQEGDRCLLTRHLWTLLRLATTPPEQPRAKAQKGALEARSCEASTRRGDREKRAPGAGGPPQSPAAAQRTWDGDQCGVERRELSERATETGGATPDAHDAAEERNEPEGREQGKEEEGCAISTAAVAELLSGLFGQPIEAVSDGANRPERLVAKRRKSSRPALRHFFLLAASLLLPQYVSPPETLRALSRLLRTALPAPRAGGEEVREERRHATRREEAGKTEERPREDAVPQRVLDNIEAFKRLARYLFPDEASYASFGGGLLQVVEEMKAIEFASSPGSSSPRSSASAHSPCADSSRSTSRIGSSSRVSLAVAEERNREEGSQDSHDRARRLFDHWITRSLEACKLSKKLFLYLLRFALTGREEGAPLRQLLLLLSLAEQAGLRSRPSVSLRAASAEEQKVPTFCEEKRDRADRRDRAKPNRREAAREMREDGVDLGSEEKTERGHQEAQKGEPLEVANGGENTTERSQWYSEPAASLPLRFDTLTDRLNALKDFVNSLENRNQ